jgi:hypothetical protein
VNGPQQGQPEFTVRAGTPTAKALAAALIVIHTLRTGRAARPEPDSGTASASGAHADRLLVLRRPLPAPRGPGAWRRSGWL